MTGVEASFQDPVGSFQPPLQMQSWRLSTKDGDFLSIPTLQDWKASKTTQKNT